VVLLTALGAWFAAVPLLIAVGMLLGDVVLSGVGPYVVGGLVLATATVVMRAKDVPLFVEQLAVPALLVGGGTLAMGLYRDFHRAGGSAVLLVVVLGLSLLLSKAWLRVLLGAVAAGLLASTLLPNWLWGRDQGSVLLVLHGLLAVWLMSLWLQERVVTMAALVEPLAAGWLLTTLLGLTWMSGTTFLVGGAVGSNEAGAMLGWVAGFERHSWQASAIQTGASVLVLAGAGVGALAWPTLRQFLPVAVALVLAALAWFMPLLGAVLLALMVTATTQRWRLASACALVAWWPAGSWGLFTTSCIGPWPTRPCCWLVPGWCWVGWRGSATVRLEPCPHAPVRTRPLRNGVARAAWPCWRAHCSRCWWPMWRLGKSRTSLRAANRCSWL
jgi:hypothetical protein